MLPARRQVRGLTATSALVAALALATFACSDGRTGPAEPDGAAFTATPDLDRAGRRIVVARNAVAAYREAGEITQQSIADQLRRRLNEAHEGVARNRVPDAIQALNRFIALVTAETPASISPSAAAALIAHARDILAILGGSMANQPPSAIITAPDDGVDFDVGDAITFSGTCTDPEDGALTGDSCAWTSSIDGDIGSGPSFVVSDLSPGTHIITLTATDSNGATDTDEITITITVVPPENQAPTADITAPADGAMFDVGDAITFNGACTDPEDGSLTGDSCAWTSSIDGDIGTGPSLIVSDLSEGTHIITLTATDSHGATDTDQITITIDGPDNQAPIADITAPADGAMFDVGDAITFTGTGTDPEDGDLTGGALVWSSSIDGPIGTGTSIMRSDLSAGQHTITLTATDTNGASGTDQITITVEVVTPENKPPTADITAPLDGATFDIGDAITFTGTGTDPEDGAVTGGALVWTSSIDGQIGTGTSIVRSDLSQGTHTITLTATDSKGLTGTDAIDIIIIVDPMGPVDLVCGGILPGSIGQAGQVNVHTFAGAAGDDVLFTFVETSGFGGIGVAAHATILTPSGAVLTTMNANVQSRDTLTESGTYTIRVNANNLLATGTYNFGLECLIPLGSTQGNLTSNAILSGTIVDPAEVDLITFSAGAGDDVLLTFVETTGFGGIGVAAALTVVAPSGAVVTTFVANAQQRHTLPESGQYIIYIRPNNLVTPGSYDVGLESLNPLGPAQGNLISNGILSGMIEDPAEVDLVTFSAGAGDDVLLTFVETGGFGGIGVAAALTVVAPSGAVLTTFVANAQQRHTLPESGQYIIYIRPNNLVTPGSYDIGLESLRPLGPAQGNLISNGIHSGMIEDPAEVDLITFSAGAGDDVLLTFVETGGFGGIGIAASLTVVAPSGAVVTSFVANDQQRHTLPEAGQYVIYVQANNLVAAGSYKVGFESLNPLGPDQGSIACNAGPFAGSIVESGEVDLNRFMGNTGDIVLFTFIETSGFGGIGVAARATVLAPSGAVVSTEPFVANGQQQHVLSEDGEYTIYFRANNLVATGDYSMTLTCT